MFWVLALFMPYSAPSNKTPEFHLKDHAMSSVFQTLLSLAGSGLVMALIYAFINNTATADSACDAQRSRPSMIYTFLMAAFGIALGLFALRSTLMIEWNWAAFTLGVFMLPSGLMLASMQLSYFRIEWNARGITGPSTYLIRARPRTTIHWQQAVELQLHWSGTTWTLMDSLGQKIHWSEYYVGHEAILAEVYQRCPQIFDAPDQ